MTDLQTTTNASDHVILASEPDRRIKLGGCYNFRDIGGYAASDGESVRWRRLYRSDGLQRLTKADVAVLRPLQIRTIVDLRTQRELNEVGTGPLHAEPGIKHLHVPLIASVQIDLDPNSSRAPDLSAAYASMLAESAGSLRAIFACLSVDGAYPAIVHCAAGKDRTGITVALILRVLGVSDHEIVADYALTDGYMQEYIAAVRASGASGLFDQVHPDLLRARAETMATFLSAFDATHGSVTAFLTSCGISPETLAKVQQNLVA